MRENKYIKKIKSYIPMSSRDWVVFFAVIFLAYLVCKVLMNVSSSDVHVPLIFVLAVLIISLITDGYFYGIIAAVVSVFTVNFAFTYPYAKMDFSIYGYPLTFITMLTVGCAVSTLTTRLKAQERLKAESEREKMRANLLRAVSHDLRTPLTSICGSIAAVIDGEESLPASEKEELLKGAKDDAEWLCRMVENLLSVTKISDTPGHIRKEQEMLEEVLSEAVVKFKKHVSGVSVSVFVPDNLLFVPMDAMLIEQLLLNLMENAVSHGRCDKIKICAEPSGKFLNISVSDNGTGIEPALLKKLFEGNQINNKPVDSSRGMGIGLSLCRAIVQAHGGEISAVNLPEGGACISFSLSLKEEHYDS